MTAVCCVQGRAPNGKGLGSAYYSYDSALILLFCYEIEVAQSCCQSCTPGTCLQLLLFLLPGYCCVLEPVQGGSGIVELLIKPVLLYTEH